MACRNIPVTSFFSYKVRHTQSHLVAGRPREPAHELGRPLTLLGGRHDTAERQCVVAERRKGNGQPVGGRRPIIDLGRK